MCVLRFSFLGLNETGTSSSHTLRLACQHAIDFTLVSKVNLCDKDLKRDATFDLTPQLWYMHNRKKIRQQYAGDGMSLAWSCLFAKYVLLTMT